MIIPGSEGEYGVTAGHSPIVAELKPGVVQVIHEPVSYCVTLWKSIFLYKNQYIIEIQFLLRV